MLPGYTEGRMQNINLACAQQKSSLIRRNRLNEQFISTQFILNKKFWEELIAYFPWYDMGHIENDGSNNSSIIACVFVIAVTFLPSRCLAMIGGYTHSNVIS
jgi:hypothetical protein